MSDAKVKIVYNGPYSGLFLSDLGIEIERGVPFEALKSWYVERSAIEPWWEEYVPAKAPKKVEG